MEQLADISDDCLMFGGKKEWDINQDEYFEFYDDYMNDIEEDDEKYSMTDVIDEHNDNTVSDFYLLWNYGKPPIPFLPRMGVQIPFEYPYFPNSDDDLYDENDDYVKHDEVNEYGVKDDDDKDDHDESGKDNKKRFKKKPKRKYSVHVLEEESRHLVNGLLGGSPQYDKQEVIDDALVVGEGSPPTMKYSELNDVVDDDTNDQFDDKEFMFPMKNLVSSQDHNYALTDNSLIDHDYAFTFETCKLLEDLDNLKDQNISFLDSFSLIQKITDNIGTIPTGMVNKACLLVLSNIEFSFGEIFTLLSESKLGQRFDTKDQLLNVGGILLECFDKLLEHRKTSQIDNIESLRRAPTLLTDILDHLDSLRYDLLENQDALRNMFIKVNDTFGKLIYFVSHFNINSLMKDDIEKTQSMLKKLSKPAKDLKRGCFTFRGKTNTIKKEHLTSFEKEEIIRSNPNRNIQFCLSQKNHIQMLLDNFLLRLKRVNKNSYSWSCVSEKCQFKVITQGGFLEEFMIEHNHETNQELYKKNLVCYKIKERAASSMGTPLSVIVQEVVGCEDYKDLHLFGATSSLKRRGKTIRRKTQPQFNNLKHISSLVLHPDMFLEDEQSKKSLLLFDNKTEGNRIIVFGRIIHLKMLCESDLWLGDGTFKACPKVGTQSFGQLYTIAGKRYSKLFTFLRVLMERRCKTSYTELFQWIKQLVENNNWQFNLKMFLTDFELAPHGGKSSVWGDEIKSKGCRFHFGQGIMKDLNEYNLKTKYYANEDFQDDVRKLLSLPFVPECDVEKRFNDVKWFLESKGSEAVKLLSRLETYYVKGEKRINGSRLPPRFPPSMWSMVENVSQSQPCTTNFLEGTHNAYRTTLTTRNHPNISSFARVMADDCKMVEKDLQIQRRNPNIPVRSVKENRKALAVMNITNEYRTDMKKMEFFDWLDDLGRETRVSSENLTNIRERPPKVGSNPVTIHWVKDFRKKDKKGNNESNQARLHVDNSQVTNVNVPDHAQLSAFYCPGCNLYCQGVTQLKSHLTVCYGYVGRSNADLSKVVGYVCPSCLTTCTNRQQLDKHLSICSLFNNLKINRS